MEECIGNGYGECSKIATYIRHTQFAGSHPLCDEHAKEDEDFLKNDSYVDWEKL